MRLETEIAGIVCNNPCAREEFQERQRAIDVLRRDVARDEGAMKDLTDEMDALKARTRGGGWEGG